MYFTTALVAFHRNITAQLSYVYIETLDGFDCGNEFQLMIQIIAVRYIYKAVYDDPLFNPYTRNFFAIIKLHILSQARMIRGERWLLPNLSMHFMNFFGITYNYI